MSLALLLAFSGLKGQSFSYGSVAGGSSTFVFSDGTPASQIPICFHFLDSNNQPVAKQWRTADDSGRITIKLVTNKGYLTTPSLAYRLSQDTVFMFPGQVYSVAVTISYITPSVDVSTGEPGRTPIDKTVNKIRVISADRIQAMGAQTLQQVLSQELNIRLSNDNILGSSLSIQGMSGQNIKILIDGVPIIGRQDGNIDLSQINLAAVERIEIIEGPMSVLYGTDATGGVINLIMKKSSKDRITFVPSAFYESSGTYNQRANFNYTSPKNRYINITGGRNFFDGIATDSIPRVMSWKPREQYFADATAGMKIRKSDQRVQLNLLDELIVNRGMPTVTPTEIYGLDDYYRTKRAQLTLHSSFELKKAQLVLTNAANYYSRVKETKRKDLTNLESVPLVGLGAGDTQVFNQFMSRAFYGRALYKKKVQMLAGYEASYENATGRRIKDEYQQQTEAALFTSFDIRPISRISIKPGARFTTNSKYGSLLSPALNFKLVNSKHTIRLSYARGFRAPSLKELYIYFVDLNHNINPNENLKAEKSHSFNASDGGNFKMFGKAMIYDVSAYFNNVGNLINLAMTDAATQTYQYINIDRAYTYGTNGSVKFARKDLQLGVGAGIMASRQYAGSGDPISIAINRALHDLIKSIPLTTAVSENFGRAVTPEFNASATYTVSKYKTVISAFAKYNGAVSTVNIDENGKRYSARMGGYATIDASVSQFFYKKKVQVTAGCRNIANVRTINFSAVSGGAVHGGSGSMNIGMGRTFFTEVKFNLTKK